MNAEPSAELVAEMQRDDQQAAFKERLRRLERQGASKAQIDAEILTAGFAPGLAARRLR